MKKLLICFLAAILMLSVYAAAPQVGPPTCAAVGGVCEADGELSGVCNDPNDMVYGETSDCYNPARLCCVPETCSDVGGWCDISCGPDYVRTSDGKCDYDEVCCREPGLSSPDAEGNVVCKGEAYETKYNPKKIREMLGDVYYEVSCDESGSIYLATMNDPGGCLYGEYGSDGRMYGEIKADSTRKTLKIVNGGFVSEEGCDGFGEYFRNKPTGFSITADTIDISFANKERPIVKISGDGAIRWGDVFFGCQKKDSNGRALSCSLSAEMIYLTSEADEIYMAGNGMLSLSSVNVEGHGFVSGLDGLQTYINRQPETIDKLKEEVGEEFVAMPLSNLKNIRLFRPVSGESNYPYTISVKTAADGSGTFNYLKIKSSTGNDVNIDAIGNRRGMQPMTEEIEIAPWHPVRDETLDVTADATRVSGEKQDAFSVNAQCADAGGSNRAKVNVFIGSNKLLEATQCNHVVIIPPATAGTGIAIADTHDFTMVRLNPQAKEIKVTRDIDDYGDLSIWMLQGYENFALVNPAGAGSICSAIPNVYIITNPRNNNLLELGDTRLEITPEGKLIPDLGFSFTAELCDNDKELMETLACSKTGECTLDGSPVFGVTAAPMQEVRDAQRTGRRFEEGAKAAGERCENDEECGRGYVCYKISSDRYGTCMPEPRQERKTCQEAGGRCQSDMCSATQINVDGRCSFPPDTGTFCCHSIRTGGLGIKTTGDSCRGDSDCNNNEVCNNGICLRAKLPPFGCEADSECRATEQCIEGECLKQCTDDMGCYQGMICNEGFCSDGCRTSIDCFGGETCENGVCVSSTSETPEIPPFSEDAKASGEEQKGALSKAWDWVKGLFS